MIAVGGQVVSQRNGVDPRFRCCPSVEGMRIEVMPALCSAVEFDDAAFDAVSPTSIVQARASFSPAARNVIGVCGRVCSLMNP